MLRRVVLLVVVVVVAAAGGRNLLDASPAERAKARFVRVVDGDTIVVRVGGEEERVRLIGIDTPESVKPGSPVECGGKAASRAMERLTRGLSTVRLVTDPTQDRRDGYGRLLRYAERPDGTDLGRRQVRDGWAAVYVFDRDHPFRRLSSYRAAARRAADEGAGVAGRCGD